MAEVEPTVRVKFLKPVGQHKIGDIAEVPKSHAEYMCAIRKVNNGYGLVDFRSAITMEELELAMNAPVALNGLSAKDMQDLGLRNIVETPKDHQAGAHFSESKAPQELASAQVQSDEIAPVAESEESLKKRGKGSR